MDRTYDKPPLTFEFTKRKRWADLLITELAEGINMILSTTRVVLYCSPAITELIGWKDTDVLDHDFLEFITADGRADFSANFDESFQHNTELLSYVRLKCKGTPSEVRDVLFEIMGHPHIMSEQETDGRCFFATAKPYPSRNTAMLNTYLELKMENEQLQARLLELRSRLPYVFNSPTAVTSPSNPVYSTSSIQAPATLPNELVSPQTFDVPTYPNPNSNSTLDDALARPTKGLFDASVLNNASTFRPSSSSTVLPSTGEDDPGDGPKKKKLKKSHLAEHYVCRTCGRTDSPEWRKGPLGPKTLCNACGLRWAKQMRKTDEPAEGGPDLNAADA